MSEMVCATGVDLLMEYLEGALPLEVRRAIDAHVNRCRRCQAFVESYQSTSRVIRESTRLEVPDDLAASLLAVLRAQRKADDR